MYVARTNTPDEVSHWFRDSVLKQADDYTKYDRRSALGLPQDHSIWLSKREIAEAVRVLKINVRRQRDFLRTNSPNYDLARHMFLLGALIAERRNYRET